MATMMSVVDTFVAALRTRLVASADPKRAAGQAKYLKNRFTCIGCTSPIVRGAVAEVAADTSLLQQPLPVVDATLARLVTGDHRELHYAAALVGVMATEKALKRRRASSRPRPSKRARAGAGAASEDPDYFADEGVALLASARRLITTNSWWDTVDLVATSMVGPVVREFRERCDPVMDEWLAAEDEWLRRTVILHQLKWKADTDEARLRAAILANAEDESFWIRKSIGWALREYSKTSPAFVTAFVADHEDSLSKLSIREGMKALRKGPSCPHLRTKAC